MMRDILAIDVGTTNFKMGVFNNDLDQKIEVNRNYSINLHDQVQADIEPGKWWCAFEDAVDEIKELLPAIGVISLSVTTPGLVAMDKNGTALNPAILFLDGRSHKQAKEIRDIIGDDYFLHETCNLPVSGGSSLCSILWIKENFPDVWRETEKFGHCNTYMVKQLTGEWAIDQTTTSITGLYNTARDDLTWNKKILSAAGLPISKLPPLFRSHLRVANILPKIASRYGFQRDTAVLAGGNDAVLAALSGGLTQSGDISNVHGTCDIVSVCVDKPIFSPSFNLRCHALPGKWMTFFVLNTGGKALEWFHSVFCSELSPECFYNEYVPSVLEQFLSAPDINLLDEMIPVYTPYLQGSRYSTDMLTASFSGLNLQTKRDDMLLALIKGNLQYLRDNLMEVGQLVKFGRKISTTGGAARIRGFLDAKRRWIGDYDYTFQDQSSLKGAAILGQWHLIGSTP